jgi:hypothetical protein
LSHKPLLFEERKANRFVKDLETAAVGYLSAKGQSFELLWNEQ